MEINNFEQETNEKRPQSLMVVCILSFVNIGWSLVSNIGASFSGPMSNDALEEYKVEITKSISQVKEVGGMNWMEDFLRGLITMTEQANANFMMSTISGIGFLIVGLIGVYLMYNRKKLGFHFYIIYSFLASVQVYLFVTPSLFSNSVVIMSLLVSSVFIFLYARHIKWMK